MSRVNGDHRILQEDLERQRRLTIATHALMRMGKVSITLSTHTLQAEDQTQTSLSQRYPTQGTVRTHRHESLSVSKAALIPFFVNDKVLKQTQREPNGTFTDTD